LLLSDSSRQSPPQRGEARRDRQCAPGRFYLYVEGPRDRDLLRTWGGLVSSALARAVGQVSVILGGRQPARALSHFRSAGGGDAGARGICLLDRDSLHDHQIEQGFDEPGLEIYTWGRRHIESYLIVADAIRRSLLLPTHDRTVERVLAAHLGEADENSLRRLDAKRLLGARGELSQAVGRPVQPSRVARVMWPGELHADVLDLLDRVCEGVGLDLPEPMTVERRPR
jgi:hypothetical protein